LRTTPDRRITPAAWWFVAGYGLSAIGTGLCYPFLTIYLHHVRNLSSSATALLLLVLAGVAVPMSVYGGSLVDRHSPRTVGVGALVVQTGGWLLLAGESGYVTQVLALAVIGVGTGLFLPAVIPIIVRLSGTDAAKARTMSLRYLLLNLGLGLGAGLAGVLLGSSSSGLYRALFAVNGVSCLLYALIILLLVPLPSVKPAPDGAPTGKVRFRPSANYILLLAAQLLLVTFGLAQLESGIPLAVRDQLHGSTRLIGLLYAIGTLFVLIGQMPISRLVERMRKTRALIGMALIWALAWLIGYAASAVHGSARSGLLIAMIVTFAIGECAYSPAFYTLVEKLVPAGALGRSSGGAWATFQVGNTVGPPVAVFIIDSDVSFWLVLAAAAAVAAVLLVVVDRRTSLESPPAPVLTTSSN